MTNAEKINAFLDRAGVWFFLTTDGDQPKGRPFRFHLLKEDKIYFGTGTLKKVYRQLQENPHVEILAVDGEEFLRYDGKVVMEKNDDIAKAVGVSRSHLYRVFMSNVGQSPIDYLTNYRISEACYLLKNSELSIAEIAVSVGFFDQFYFSRVFKKNKGVPPSRYLASLTPTQEPSSQE